MSIFHIGQRIVCVDAELHVEWQMKNTDLTAALPLAVDAIYTVRGFGIHPGDGLPRLLLVEIVRARTGADGSEKGFLPRRFRPVAYPKQSLEHDIEIFTRIGDHIDPIVRADVWEQDMAEANVRLSVLLDALNRSDLP